jgi:DNA-binding SARP family transcriptional activator
LLKRPDTYLLKTFGGLHLVGSDGAPVELSRRRLALLALLAVAGERGAPRERLVAFLWPDSPTEAGRHSLEQMLSAVRARLGADVFIGTDPVRLDERIVQSDLAALRGVPTDAEAVEPPDGPFLDGFYLEGLKEFEEWVERERGRLHEVRLDAVAALARRATEPAESVRLWRRYVHLDPLRTEGALGLMRALAAAGDRAAAVRHARVFQRLLRDDLELSPDPAVLALCSQLEAEGGPVPGPSQRRPEGVKEVRSSGARTDEPGPAWRTRVRGSYRRRAVAAAITLVVVVTFVHSVRVADFQAAGDAGRAFRLERTQVTFGGNAFLPALSRDDSRLAYAIAECEEGGRCRFDVVVQDLRESGVDTVAHDFDWLQWRIQWSADDRYLVLRGRRAPEGDGTWVVPVAGGALRYLGCCAGRPDRNADTLVLVGGQGHDADAGTLRVLTLGDGVVHDSFRIPPARPRATGAATLRSPEGRRFSLVTQYVDSMGIRVVSRDGRAGRERTLGYGSYVVEWTRDGAALLLVAEGPRGHDFLRWEVRDLELWGDPAPLLRGVEAGGVPVLSESGTLVFAVGAEEHQVWALLPRHDASGGLMAGRELDRATAPIRGMPSPEGSTVLLARRVGGVGGLMQLAVSRVDGGPPTPLGAPLGGLVDFGWLWDGAAAWVLRRHDAGRYALESVDSQTGLRRGVFELGSAEAPSGLALPGGGWGLLFTDLAAVRLRGPGGVPDTLITVPEWLRQPSAITASPDGSRILVVGRDQRADSGVVAVLDPAAMSFTKLGSLPGPGLDPFWAPDGSVHLGVHEGGGSVGWYRLMPDGGAVRVGRRPDGWSERLPALHPNPLADVQYSFARNGSLIVANKAIRRADIHLIHGFRSLLE